MFVDNNVNLISDGLFLVLQLLNSMLFKAFVSSRQILPDHGESLLLAIVLFGAFRFAVVGRVHVDFRRGRIVDPGYTGSHEVASEDCLLSSTDNS